MQQCWLAFDKIKLIETDNSITSFWLNISFLEVNYLLCLLKFIKKNILKPDNKKTKQPTTYIVLGYKHIFVDKFSAWKF